MLKNTHKRTNLVDLFYQYKQNDDTNFMKKSCELYVSLTTLLPTFKLWMSIKIVDEYNNYSREDSMNI